MISNMYYTVAHKDGIISLILTIRDKSLSFHNSVILNNEILCKLLTDIVGNDKQKFNDVHQVMLQ